MTLSNPPKEPSPGQHGTREKGSSTPEIRISVTDRLLDQIQRAAMASGRPLDRWVAQALADAAEDDLVLAKCEQEWLDPG